jgi:hypothetical protein
MAGTPKEADMAHNKTRSDVAERTDAFEAFMAADFETVEPPTRRWPRYLQIAVGATVAGVVLGYAIHNAISVVVVMVAVALVLTTLGALTWREHCRP